MESVDLRSKDSRESKRLRLKVSNIRLKVKIVEWKISTFS
jgi:hypothetical protein